MFQIGVLGVVLSLNGVMGQKVETSGVRIAVHNSQELQFVEPYQLVNGFAKGIQETLCLWAIDNPLPPRPHFRQLLHS